MAHKQLVVMGSFVADLAFRTPQLPSWGQTILGSGFRLGPGGKGSNQAVAAARLGVKVAFITKLGCDPFGDLARTTYRREGIDARYCFETKETATGGAAVIVHETKGENAIVVVPGSGYSLTVEDVDRATPLIRDASVFMTQLEVPLQSMERGLELAHDAGTQTILNPAPAAKLPDRVYPLCDYLTPNESEAADLIDEPVRNLKEAERAADVFLRRGVRNVVITLGENGALVKNARLTEHVPAIDAGPVVETTGAGDAFNGGFAVGLLQGMDIVEATRFGCAVAGISVTRHGTAPAMPRREEVDALLKRS